MPKVTNFRKAPDLPKLEEETLKYWQDNKIFEKSIEQRPKDKAFVFYDGPPFATGMPHYGHLLASTVKDVIPRYWTMKGYRVNRVWGWDCHGLPIENMIENKFEIKGGKKGIEKLGIDKFNQACRSEVMQLDSAWEKIIGRLGRWVDFKNNYKTMDASFMESVWWGFGQLFEKGLVYEGRKVILYCPRCSTPLSNFEIAMDNSYEEVTENSTTYKYKVVGEENTYLLAWSTTPWNKLATPALAVNANLTYVKVSEGNEFYYLAESTLEQVLEDDYEVVEKLTGEELAKKEFELHFDFYKHDRDADQESGVVVADDFVTAQEGTGVVTLAAYGEDDYRVMLREKVQIIEHVDEEGKLKAEVEPWAGMDILEVNSLVDEDLQKRGLIYKQKKHQHSVATCYRCGTRLYYAPLPAWFIDIQKIKSKLLEENEKINWYPEHLKHGRFQHGLENAPDWNISRSRYWGTPMPIWRGEDKSGEQRQRIISSVEELKKWAVNPKQVENLTDIHREFLDDIEIWVDDEKSIKGKRIPEVFDCWVESGSMPFASVHYPFANQDFFENNYPAQFVSEYIAQTRAWFYTMHVLSVGIFGKPSFENVLTTGTILAEDGSKMSKSKKNYPDPMKLIDAYGVDSLRLYLMSSTVMKGENLNFNEKEVADIRRKVFVIFWNMLSFYKSFADTTVAVDKKIEKEAEHVLDRWLLSKLDSLTTQVSKELDAYDVVKSSRRLMDFVNELSTWYLRLSRDRLRAKNNKQVSQVFAHALYTLAQLFAPFAPFFSELVQHNLVIEESSIHLSNWPKVKPKDINQKLENEMEEVKKVVEAARAKRQELGIKLRQPLSQAKVSSTIDTVSQELLELIAQEINVKKVIWQKADELSIKLETKLSPELKAEGEARELIREIQNLRKKAGCKVDEKVKLIAPNWPESFEDYIKERTLVSEIAKGSKLALG